MNELFPNWREMDNPPPLTTPVKSDTFMLLKDNGSLEVPHALMPKMINNHGNFIISLGNLCDWLNQQAEELGVEVLSGIAGDKVIFNENGAVGGVVTGDFGWAKDGQQKDNFSPGIKIKAKQTIFTEGARGSLTERLKKQFKLDKDAISTQQYGLGLKEVWQVKEGNPLFKEGHVQHTAGWPLTTDVYGGSFCYHMKPNLVHLGMVIGLDYTNPYLNPYEEFQRLKTHKAFRGLLEGGECISYGARVLNEGGFHAIPKLTFPGGMLAGCSAGFLNVAKIKGSHNAMKTGMLAAEAIFEAAKNDNGLENADIKNYEKNVRNSWVAEELRQSRNFKAGFEKGLWFGLAHGGIIMNLTKGKEPWTWRHTKKDCDSTVPKSQAKKIEYPKHDGKLTFDLLTNLQRSGTNHEHDQPSHLKIKPELADVPQSLSYQTFGAPEERFCPAKVYEYIVDEATQAPKLQINAQNCLHCKCCSIKMPKEYIDWNVPEGGGGPSYSGM